MISGRVDDQKDSPAELIAIISGEKNGRSNERPLRQYSFL